MHEIEPHATRHQEPDPPHERLPKIAQFQQNHHLCHLVNNVTRNGQKYA